MQIVNGYLCECTDEVKLAKRGIDPDNPKQDPLKQLELDARHGDLDAIEKLEESKSSGPDFRKPRDPFADEAVRFGGALRGSVSASLSSSSTAPDAGATDRGLDILA